MFRKMSEKKDAKKNLKVLDKKQLKNIIGGRRFSGPGSSHYSE